MFEWLAQLAEQRSTAMQLANQNDLAWTQGHFLLARCTRTAPRVVVLHH